MHTLVISDLHLGTPTGRDRLRREGLPAALLAELGRTDRLVLLGDMIELRFGPQAAALEEAAPVLGALARALPAAADVIIVPGNHDHHLLDAWIERCSASGPPPLDLSSVVDVQPGDLLSAVADALAPAEVRVCYPGAWLRDDVYATHGHYGDRHTTVPMLERLAAGVMARVVAESPAGPSRPADYEAVLAPIYAWIHAVAQTGGPQLGRSSRGASAGAWQILTGDAPRPRRRLSRLRRQALVRAFPALIGTLNRIGVGPLRAELSGPELRRASLRAVGEVVDRLEVDAEFVIFGHTHRAGPLPADEPREWRSGAGRRLMNCGSWVHEPAFLGSQPQSSPYRAGFAVRLEEKGPPKLVNLLD